MGRKMVLGSQYTKNNSFKRAAHLRTRTILTRSERKQPLHLNSKSDMILFKNTVIGCLVKSDTPGLLHGKSISDRGRMAPIKIRSKLLDHQKSVVLSKYQRIIRRK